MSAPVVLNTRPAEQAGELSDALRQVGLMPVEVPAIHVVPAWDLSEVREVAAYLRAGEMEWLVLPSVNAARCFVEAITALGEPVPLVVPVLCGPRAAEAARAERLQVQEVVDPFSAARSTEILLGRGVRSVLVARAKEGRPELVDRLRTAGTRVVDLPVYRTEAVEPSTLAAAADLLLTGVASAVTFASPSAAASLVGGLRALGHDPLALLGRTRVVCIGTTTAAEAERLGLNVAAIAAHTSVASLAEATADSLRVLR